jgi:hypothetical protein
VQNYPIKALVDRLTLWFVPMVLALASGHSDGLADLGAGTGATLCAGGWGLRSDHRVPLRDGISNTDLNHGGYRPCRLRWGSCFAKAMPCSFWQVLM